jgi:amino acid adenylation domain-containing protein
MNDLASRIASLPPAKRALLERRLLAGASGRGSNAVSIARRGEREAPLSFSQQRLWFLEQLEPGTSLYNVPEAIALEGPLDVAALEAALAALVSRHEVLRTSFGGSNGEPTARVEDVSVVLTITDLTAIPGDRREGDAQTIAAEEAETPFDLRRVPLLRARLLRLAPDLHWLLLTMHHIVCDDWSMGVLFSELSRLYRPGGQPSPDELPPLPIQYGDYAAWQRENSRGARLDRDLSYWKARLSGDLPVMALPWDRPRPALPSHHGSEHRRRLRPALTAALENLSRCEGATLFMTILAAFDVLLARYAGQGDVLVGTPIAGRLRRETEGLIGFFVNTLVMRVDLSADPTFRALLRIVREGALEAFAHQNLPFEKLVEELRPGRDLARTPIFQVMFELDNAPGAMLDIEGLRVTPIELPDAGAKFDLRLLAVNEEDGLLLVFEYATDLFDEATVARMAANFEVLLEGAVADPERPVSRLPLVSEPERRLLLHEWNRTAVETSAELLPSLFAAQAARTPDAVAIEYEGETLTYSELDRQSNRLAEHLRDLGVGPDVPVGLCVPRSPEMAIGIFGVLKAGGAYVPLDPMYPSERLAFMLQDSGVGVLVTLEAVEESLPPFAGRVVRLDADRAAIQSRRGDSFDAGLRSDHLAYVMYTSGSTGRPKGVMVTHRGLTNYLAWCVRAYDIEGGSGAPVQSSLSFDLTITGLFGPLLCGRRVKLLPEGFAIEALSRALRERAGFSVIKITPARLDLLTRETAPDAAAGRTGAFVVGGEALRFESLALWREFAPGTAIFNEYGPTETVVGCAIYRVGPKDPPSGPVPIGRPIANTRLYVLDRYFEPVPIGAAGELYVGGVGVARGYWRRPELTAERFLPDPFTGSEGARMYRTGDLARYRGDGNLEFLGRTDDQVKVRGFRIELGEIENAIREHSSVRDAAAAVREEGGDRRLVAYVVLKPGLPWGPEAIRRHVADRIPDYMVPSAFVRLDALPLTKNGKIDRQVLPSPKLQRRQLEKDYEPPRDALELHLARTWEAVLQTAPIGLDDDFFDLGGHSLLAVRLFAEIEKTTGKKLPLASLFQAPTVGQLAEILRQWGWSSPWSSLVPIQPRGTRPPFYCVHAAGGSVLPYRALSTRLGPDQPFYGLQARGLDDTQGVPERLEDMAEAYLAEIRALQPEGPYYIGGHSAGGLVAFEMAQRLRERGQKVGLVALFDTWAPGHGEFIPEKYLRTRLSQFWMKWNRFLTRLREGGKVVYLREKLEIRIRVLMGRTSTLPPKLQELRDAIEDAADDYRPRPYDGPLTLFRAQHQPAEYALDGTLGWGALARGGIDVHQVPGYHGEIVQEPQASVLAEQLRQCLERAAREEEPQPSSANAPS